MGSGASSNQPVSGHPPNPYASSALAPSAPSPSRDGGSQLYPDLEIMDVSRRRTVEAYSAAPGQDTRLRFRRIIDQTVPENEYEHYANLHLLPATHRHVKPTERPISGTKQTLDTSRDLVLSRIMAADEFLDRMDEADRRIGDARQVEDQGTVYQRIKELVGLRGHLQDELLRIEAMLAADDPKLERLADFEENYGHVVYKLRELAAKSRAISAITSNQNETPAEDEEILLTIPGDLATVDMVTFPNGPVPLGSRARQTSVQVNPQLVRNVSFEPGTNVDTGVSEDATSASQIEDKYTRKHNEEEERVNEDYAKRLANDGKHLTREQMDKLLNDHLLSMQALRQKQDHEKAAAQARLRKRLGQLRKHSEPATLTMKTGTVTEFTINNKRSRSGSHCVLSRASSQQDDRPITPQSVAAILGGSVNGFMAEIPGRATAAPLVSGTLNEGLPSEDEFSEDEIVIDKHPPGALRYEGGDYSDDFEQGFSDSEDESNEALRSTLQDNIWSQHQNMTSQDFKDMMGQFREQQEELSRQAKDAREKNTPDVSDVTNHMGISAATSTDAHTTISVATGPDDPVSSRPSSGRSSGPSSGRSSQASSPRYPLITGLSKKTDLDENDEEFIARMKRERPNVTDAEFAELLKQHLADADAIKRMRKGEKSRYDDMLAERLGRKGRSDVSPGDDDEKTEKALADLDENLKAEISSKRKELTEDELRAIMARYRKEQKSIISKRKSEKERTNELLQERLDERERQRKEKKAGGIVSNLDDSFFQQLQQRQRDGDLSQEAFHEMMTSYMAMMESSRKKEKQEEKKKRREGMEQKARVREEVRQSVNSLVHEHEANRKQIANIRRRERSNFDDQLEKRLAKIK